MPSCSSCNESSPLVFSVQTFMNASCGSGCGDSTCTSSDGICYTGPDLVCSGIVTNDTLTDALTKIDEILCENTGNYSTYFKHCLETWAGYVVNTEALFVNAITSYVCEVDAALKEFRNVTFEEYKTEIETNFEGLTEPQITCVSAGVTTADNLETVLTKYCSKFSSIDTALDLSSIDFDDCFTVTTPPTTVIEGFTEVLSQICQVKAIAEANGAVLPTFNNVGSCLATPLTTTDSLESTVNKIKTKLCTLPTWDYTTRTWGCIGSPSTNDLGEGIQKIITKVNSLLPNFPTFGTGFTTSLVDAGDPCQGILVELDANPDRLVASNAIDATPGTLVDKLLGTGITINDTATPGKITLISDRKLFASNTDTVADFLINKIGGSSDGGITITPTYNSITKKVDLILNVDSSIFCDLIAQCGSVIPCSNYRVTTASTSSLNYTNCEGTIVDVATFSGYTDICAKVNSVYAPNATIVNTGACVDPSMNIPYFSLINNTTDVTVNNVLALGVQFYSITAGAYPVAPGVNLTGIGNTSDIININLTFGTATVRYISLYKNDVSIAVYSGSTTAIYNTSAVPFAVGDNLTIAINNEFPVGLFSVDNNSASLIITSVAPVFFTISTGSFPVNPAGLLTGVGITSLPITVTTNSTAAGKTLRLVRNGTTQQTIVTTTGTSYTFNPVNFLELDNITIVAAD